MLVDEGALLLKFWFHLSKQAQKARLKALEADPKTRWRISDTDWERFKLYDRFREVSELALRRTSTGHAPWTVVEGTDPNYRYLTVGRAIAEAVQRRLAGDKPATPHPAALPEPPAGWPHRADRPRLPAERCRTRTTGTRSRSTRARSTC